MESPLLDDCHPLDLRSPLLMKRRKLDLPLLDRASSVGHPSKLRHYYFAGLPIDDLCPIHTLDMPGLP